ncbi:MAG: hypothetical protein R3A44_41195 [Caldilineaceae bacterium]
MHIIRRYLTKVDAMLILLLSLSVLAITPLFAPGYFYAAHDGRHSVFYLIQFDASIRDGALWPRWAMHHIQGYGYPTFIIQAPLGFYLGELFVLLGAGYTLAAKLSWAMGFLASGWGMYALVRYWIGRYGKSHGDTNLSAKLAAVVGGLIYVFLPYHLVDIYVRAALNDTLLLAWFPWVFLTFDKLVDGGMAPGWPRRLALAILCLAGMLLTHTFALISFAPLTVTFVLFRLTLAWRIDRTTASAMALRNLGQRTLLAGLGGVGSLLLCANFILPLLVEGQNLQEQVYTTNTYDFHRHFVYFSQFFSPFWGFGYSDDPFGVNDGMSFQVGVIALLLAIAAVFSLVRTRANVGQVSQLDAPRRPLLIVWLTAYLMAITAALLLIMTPVAARLWETVTALAVIQFPWRLLALAGFSVSALGGIGLWQLVHTMEFGSALEQDSAGGLLVFGLLAVFAGAGYIGAPLQPVEPWREDGRAIFRFEAEHPDMIAYTKWVKEPFTESPMTKDYQADAYREEYGENGVLERLAIIAGRGQILSQYSRGSSAGGVVQADGPITVRVHLLYFPGWRAYVDGTATELRVSDPYGLIEVDVPAGQHRLDVHMEATPVRRLGTVISWSALIVVMGLFWWSRRNVKSD